MKNGNNNNKKAKNRKYIYILHVTYNKDEENKNANEETTWEFGGVLNNVEPFMRYTERFLCAQT